MRKCQNKKIKWLQTLVLIGFVVFGMLLVYSKAIEMNPEVEEAFDPDDDEDSIQR